MPLRAPTLPRWGRALPEEAPLGGHESSTSGAWSRAVGLGRGPRSPSQIQLGTWGC